MGIIFRLVCSRFFYQTRMYFIAFLDFLCSLGLRHVITLAFVRLLTQSLTFCSVIPYPHFNFVLWGSQMKARFAFTIIIKLLDKNYLFSWIFDICLSGSEPCNWNAEWRTTHIVKSNVVTEFYA